MSFKATAWAWEQTGLKPSPKMVLLCLADCHNPRKGCFPSQAYIADQCEMDRATVNRHLKTLEARGLIRREKAFDQATKRQLPTRYHLAFEGAEATPETPQDEHDPVSQDATRAVSQNDPEPCCKKSESRVAKRNSNLVKEKIINPRGHANAGARKGARVVGFAESQTATGPTDLPASRRNRFDEVQNAFRDEQFEGSPVRGLRLVEANAHPVALTDWGRWMAENGLPELYHFPLSKTSDKGATYWFLPWPEPPKNEVQKAQALRFFKRLLSVEAACHAAE